MATHIPRFLCYDITPKTTGLFNTLFFLGFGCAQQSSSQNMTDGRKEPDRFVKCWMWKLENSQCNRSSHLCQTRSRQLMQTTALAASPTALGSVEPLLHLKQCTELNILSSMASQFSLPPQDCPTPTWKDCNLKD